MAETVLPTTQTGLRLPTTQKPVRYPESDGKPIADNTLQFEWIMTLKGGFDALFADRPDVFVAGDLLWYPVEGDNRTRIAPDTLLVFGRPKGYRGSYLQWEEQNIAPQVVWEVLSPGNRTGEMERKFRFYERFGVLEYYVYDPYKGHLRGWVRSSPQESFVPLLPIHDAISPRTGVRFDLSERDLVLWRPDGERFLTYQESIDRNTELQNLAEQERLARLHAEEERDAVARRTDLLLERLQALGVDPDTLNL